MNAATVTFFLLFPSIQHWRLDHQMANVLSDDYPGISRYYSNVK